ncbi:hypothetical protein [Dokdonia sp. PRO95]|uniref:hypothetical protein n=1 Tax=Dokdonia sp. PRO95 TaxID=1239415 RepID=UPI0005573E3A|nr:hypothetical protein [Dokdonia sp. PRO95]
MKKLIYTVCAALFTITAAQAQETIEETTTTRTTVKSSLGNETLYKTEKVSTVTPTQLDPTEKGQLNQTLQRGNTVVKREVTYTYNDSEFNLKESEDGYTIMRTRDNDTSEYGTMRQLAKGDVYLLKTANGISVSYFDEDGNMVSEEYNNDDDSVKTVTYKIKKTPTSTQF